MLWGLLVAIALILVVMAAIAWVVYRVDRLIEQAKRGADKVDRRSR